MASLSDMDFSTVVRSLKNAVERLDRLIQLDAPPLIIEKEIELIERRFLLAKEKRPPVLDENIEMSVTNLGNSAI